MCDNSRILAFDVRILVCKSVRFRVRFSVVSTNIGRAFVAAIAPGTGASVNCVC